ncbi:MAG: hypothetical protein GYB65_00605 [Chloroflexi bacterium]|nr:hypothetical protein [Chloroflexota bacterium]
MKRVHRWPVVLVLALLVSALLMSACSPSPQKRADDFARALAPEIGDWNRRDDDTIQLDDSVVSNQGQVTLRYQGPRRSEAYVNVLTFSSENAAEVAAENRKRELLLDGVELTLRWQPQVPGLVPAYGALDGLVWYVVMQDGEIMLEINAISQSESRLVEEETLAPVIDAAREAFTDAND